MTAIIHVTPPVDTSPVTESAVRLLCRTVEERCGAELAAGAGRVEIELAVESGVGKEGFRIEDAAGCVRVVGEDDRGLLYGVGKLLRDARYAPGQFTAGSWRGTSVPSKPVRAMYFASHFHNFYHDAPLEAVERYVEELALWGCNALSVWFDMHHYTGIEDPAAQAMIERLRAILKAGNRVGMGAALTMLANEGYAGSPETLRAEWQGGQNGYTSAPGGHYHVELCPYKAGGLEQILSWRRDVLAAFADVEMEYVWVWPYDQGGCTCSRCAPWGANGFIKTAKALAPLIREHCPQANIVLSSWYFDHFTSGEWEGLSRELGDRKPDWADYLLADDFGGFPEYPLTHGVPGRLPMVGFPEISMERMWPWGGFGANPRPSHWQAYWDKAGTHLDGSFPYSEGIFEDINKVMLLQLEWSPDRTTRDVAREYAAYEFDPAVADDVVVAMEKLEQSLDHKLGGDLFSRLWTVAEYEGGGDAPAAPTDLDAFLSGLYGLDDVVEPGDTLRLLDAAETRLPDVVRAGWRWRILKIRATLDAELQASGGKPTKVSEQCFDELVAIYHAEAAQPAVAPPSVKTLRRLSAGG